MNFSDWCASSSKPIDDSSSYSDLFSIKSKQIGWEKSMAIVPHLRSDMVATSIYHSIDRGLNKSRKMTIVFKRWVTKNLIIKKNVYDLRANVVGDIDGIKFSAYETDDMPVRDDVVPNPHPFNLHVRGSEALAIFGNVNPQNNYESLSDVVKMINCGSIAYWNKLGEAGDRGVLRKLSGIPLGVKPCGLLDLSEVSRRRSSRIDMAEQTTRVEGYSILSDFIVLKA